MAEIDYTLHNIPPLQRPIFVMAFRGLFDMGEAATAAVDWLSMTHSGHPAASIDPESLFDFHEVRPEVRIGANGNREIHWPANNIVWAKTADGSPDLVLLSGVEPNLRWRSFGQTLQQIATHVGAGLVVTLGSTLAMVPHSRAFPVATSTGDPRLAERLNIGKPTYEGPTGLIGALHQQLNTTAGMLSLRVSVPHYVPGSPSPKATAALLAELEQICGIPTSHAGLADEIRDWESRVFQAVSEDVEVQDYIEQLESTADNEPAIVRETEGLADEIESYLRERFED